MADNFLFRTLCEATNLFPPSIYLVVVCLAISYWFALPRPLPGIPYNKAARWSILGDLTSVKAFAAERGETYTWFAEQCLRLNSPIVQVFLGNGEDPLF